MKMKQFFLEGLFIVNCTMPLFGQFTLTDNKDNSKNGVSRQITITSAGQIEMSFWGYLGASIDHVYDVLNDPGKTTVLNDTVYPARAKLTHQGDNNGVFCEVDYGNHNGYKDQLAGNSWVGGYQNEWASVYGADTPLIVIKVLEDNSVRKKIDVQSYWVGYDGNGRQSHYNRDHLFHRIFTVYSDGALFIKNTETLNTSIYTEKAALRSTFIIPGINSSTDSFKLAAGLPNKFQGYYVPYPTPAAEWALQFGHPLTKLNVFISEYGDHSLPFYSGHWGNMYFHFLAGGTRYGWAVEPETDTLKRYEGLTKSYYLQFGLEGSKLLPNFAIGTGYTATCNFSLADSFSNDYRHPAVLSSFTNGKKDSVGYDESEGAYTVIASSSQARFSFDPGLYSRIHPRFRIAGWTDVLHKAVLVADGLPMAANEYVTALKADTLLVHVLKNINKPTILQFIPEGIKTKVLPDGSVKPGSKKSSRAVGRGLSNAPFFSGGKVILQISTPGKGFYSSQIVDINGRILWKTTQPGSISDVSVRKLLVLN